MDNRFIKNTFLLSDAEQEEYLRELIKVELKNNYCATDYNDSVIEFELDRITKSGLIQHFFIGYVISHYLKSIDESKRFIGIGCCSYVAYILDITENELNPLKKGLIFERCFTENQKKYNDYYIFGFYVDQSNINFLIEYLKSIYGETVSLKNADDNLLLSINNVFIRIVSDLHELQEQYLSYNLFENYSFLTFQEDYMHLLHFAAGYTYDQANEIRKLASKKEYDKLNKIKEDFNKRCNKLVSQNNCFQLFYSTTNGIPYARCKAYVLSLQLIVNNISR